MVSLEAIRPIEPSPSKVFVFPSFISISSTEENLQPKRAGKPPFVKRTFLMASALNTEKKPNKCEAL